MKIDTLLYKRITYTGDTYPFFMLPRYTSIMTKNESEEEVFKVSGEELLKKIKELIQHGNASKIIIKNEKGDALIEIPVSVGVVGAMLLPVLAAVGAIAALVTNCTIVVIKK